MADERPLRFCDLCGGLDDHPRHMRNLGDGPNSEDGRPDQEFLAGVTTDGAPVQAVERLTSSSLSEHHFDCGAEAGCESCIQDEAASGGKRGQKLIDYVLAESAKQEA
jgi:hypothetical protein